MTKLNDIELWWNMKGEENTSLEGLIHKALEAWNNKKDTRDVVPEYIIFNEDNEIEDKEVLGLIVLKERQILKNHFALRGTIE